MICYSVIIKANADGCPL